ncbi:MAG: hypothetical protein AAB793_03550 [Patescibacteria group bacterium]
MDPRYQELLNAIVQKQASILGVAVTVRRTRKVAGLVVGDDGKILSLTQPPLEALEQITKEFIDLSGDVGKVFCKVVAKETLKKYPDLKLPEILKD